jgi:hypothetical protein
MPQYPGQSRGGVWTQREDHSLLEPILAGSVEAQPNFIYLKVFLAWWAHRTELAQVPSHSRGFLVPQVFLIFPCFPFPLGHPGKQELRQDPG